ncbi:MAG: SurA N-terminal domain-containing protein [Chloroflexota bacterium]
MNKTRLVNRLLVFVIPLGLALVAVALLLKGLGAPLPTPAPATPTPDPARQVVARVGEQTFTFADWAMAYTLDALMSRLSGQPAPAPAETLERLVNDALVLQAAAEAGIGASQAEVEARITLLEAAWDTSDQAVVDELAALGLDRQVWVEAISRLLIVERYLSQKVWADAPPDGQAAALGEWLQTRRRQVQVEVDSQGLQPLLPTPRPLSTAAPTLPIATPTATSLAASPLQVLPDSNLVGRPAPDFSLPDATGQLVSLGDLRDRRKVILVFFRTTG